MPPRDSFSHKPLTSSETSSATVTPALPPMLSLPAADRKLRSTEIGALPFNVRSVPALRASVSPALSLMPALVTKLIEPNSEVASILVEMLCVLVTAPLPNWPSSNDAQFDSSGVKNSPKPFVLESPSRRLCRNPRSLGSVGLIVLKVKLPRNGALVC